MLSLKLVTFSLTNSFYLELFTFLWTNMLSFELVVLSLIIVYSLELVIFSKTIVVIFITSYFFMKKPCNLWNYIACKFM